MDKYGYDEYGEFDDYGECEFADASSSEENYSQRSSILESQDLPESKDLEEDLENQLFGEISDDLDIESDEIVPGKKITKVLKQEIVTSDVPDLKLLDNIEKKYLPIFYISSLKAEWLYLQEACLSNFKNVNNLARVSNKTISHVANVAQYALQQKTEVLKDVNIAFINYAIQRNV
jgi:hypothetical protein